MASSIDLINFAMMNLFSKNLQGLCDDVSENYFWSLEFAVELFIASATQILQLFLTSLINYVQSVDENCRNIHSFPSYR